MSHVFQEIPVTKAEVINCLIGEWYPKYKKHIPKCHVIRNLPRAFRDYILADGIQMPASYFAGDDEEGLSEKEKKELRLKRAERDPTTKFKDLHEEIERVIKGYGAAYPKLNWSAPRDAAWMLPNHQIKCISANDVYLLLNSSSYIVHDLTEALADCADVEDAKQAHEEIEYQLVLRKWFNVSPSGEFRCFVRDRQLVAISQRDPNYYDFLEGMRLAIEIRLVEFFEDNLKDSFPNKSFVFDVYCPKVEEKIWLIDINPFSRTTDALLFSWNEILNLKSLELRLVNRYSTAKFAAKEHSENHVPFDVVDAAGDTQKMIELMKAYQGQESSDSEDD